MKKSFLLFISFFLVTGLTGQAQILNGNFESWNTLMYSNPESWSTGNDESFGNTGLTPVTQVSGLTGSAVRLETLVNGNDTAQAYIANGDPMAGEGGIPCSQIPTSITGYYRYSIPGNDSALLLVIFKSGGSIINSDLFMIKGTGTQNTFAPFSFPLSLSSMPDSVIIAAASSNLIANTGIEAGSFLELDDIGFSGASVPIPNSSFETWVQQSFDVVNDWMAMGDIAKVMDSHTGNFAIRLTTTDYGNGNVGTAYLTNGQPTNNGTVGGIPYTRMNDTLTGYYKYTSSGSDSGSVSLSLSNNGSPVGGGGMLLPDAAAYTYFEIPLNAGAMPDTMRIDISSSKWPATPSSAGSVLVIDDLVMKSELTTGIAKTENRSMHAGVYPNPATDHIFIRLENALRGRVKVSVYDLAGRLMKSDTYVSGQGDLRLNVSNLNTGMYFYEVIGDHYTQRNSFTRN